MASVVVEGTVSHHFSKGIRVQESGEYGKRWTVWTDERPTIGTPVKVSGRHGAKVDERDGKHYIDLTVNFPTIEVQGNPQPATAPQTAAQPQQGAYTAGGADHWGTVNDNDAPF